MRCEKNCCRNRHNPWMTRTEAAEEGYKAGWAITLIGCGASALMGIYLHSTQELRLLIPFILLCAGMLAFTLTYCRQAIKQGQAEDRKRGIEPWNGKTAATARRRRTGPEPAKPGPRETMAREDRKKVTSWAVTLAVIAIFLFYLVNPGWDRIFQPNLIHTTLFLGALIAAPAIGLPLLAWYSPKGIAKARAKDRHYANQPYPIQCKTNNPSRGRGSLKPYLISNRN